MIPVERLANATGTDPVPLHRLAREVWGIGFGTADTIARAVGIPPDAPERLQAGVLHAFAGAGDDGQTLLPQGELVTAAGELLQVEPDSLDPAIAALLDTGSVIGATREGAREPLVALAPFARAESGLAVRLRALAAASQTARVARAFAAVE